jgi:hypothetical protein
MNNAQSQTFENTIIAPRQATVPKNETEVCVAVDAGQSDLK